MDLIKVNPFTNVVATGKATSTWIPPFPCSLHGFVFQLAGTFVLGTHITGVTVKAGNKRLVPGISGTRLQDLYEYEGLINDAAYFSVLFGDPTARTMNGKHLGNFDHTIYPGNMTIEVDISGATAPVLDCWAMVMPPKLAMGVGYSQAEAELHRALVETTIQTSAAVTEKAFDIGLGSEAGALLKKLVFFHEGDLTQLSIKKAGFDIYEQIPNALAAYLQDDMYTRLPQANVVVYDAIIDGDYSEVKTTIKPDGTPYNYQVRLSVAGAETIVTYADVLTKLPLL